jgi:hypothetical protein
MLGFFERTVLCIFLEVPRETARNLGHALSVSFPVRPLTGAGLVP